MFSHIIFDFDGTLADSDAHMIEIAHAMNVPEFNDDAIAAIRELGAREALKQSGISIWRLFFLIRAFQKKLDGEKIELFDGMVPILKKIRRHKTMGILSSNKTEVIHTVLERFGIADLFLYNQGGSSLFGKHKKLQAILKKQGLKKSEVIYIGDEDRDIEAAKKAGIACWAVTWGRNSSARLKEMKPDYMIDAPEELLSLLRS